MLKLVAVLGTAAVALTSVGAAGARPQAGPAASAVVLQAADVPGAKVVAQKGASLGAGVTQYLRTFRLSSPYGASKYVMIENIAVVVPDAVTGGRIFATVANAFSSTKARRTLETGLAKEAFATKQKAKTPAPKVVFAHESLRQVPLGDRGVEIAFTAVQGAKRIDASVSIFHVGPVIEEVVARGAAAQTVEADTLSLGKLVLTRLQGATAPVSTAPPTIAGTAQQGQTLTAAPGTWTNAPATFAYQWQRCDAAGANCADVAGSTAATYAVTSADVGTTLRVEVTPTNAGGAAAAAVPSAPTAVVQ